MSDTLHPQTLAIRAGREHTSYQEHNQALFLTSSFTWETAAQAAALFSGQSKGYTYTRTANPTVAAYNQRIAQLAGGEQALSMASGMAAIHAALLTFLSAGDELISSRSLFGTTMGLIQNQISRFGINIHYVSPTSLSQWQAAISDKTKVLFLETPSNPLGEVADLCALAEIAHQAGALLIVDNTLCSPALSRPLEFGADLVVESATKMIDGHGRVQGGTVIGSANLMKEIQVYMNASGLTLSPFHAWTLLSGLETLHLRMEKQCANAAKLAHYLRDHPQVNTVYHTSFADHPQAALIAKQQAKGGIIIGFEVKGTQQDAWQVIDKVKIFSRTANLGDVRSTICHPYTTTHGRMSSTDKQQAGIKETLIRLSVGLEDCDDLIADISQALGH